MISYIDIYTRWQKKNFYKSIKPVTYLISCLLVEVAHFSVFTFSAGSLWQFFQCLKVNIES